MRDCTASFGSKSSRNPILLKSHFALQLRTFSKVHFSKLFANVSSKPVEGGPVPHCRLPPRKLLVSTPLIEPFSNSTFGTDKMLDRKCVLTLPDTDQLRRVSALLGQHKPPLPATTSRSVIGKIMKKIIFEN